MSNAQTTVWVMTSFYDLLLSAPTHPREVEVTALPNDELKVTWKPPNKPNGNVTHYYVYWQSQPLNREKLDQRDYCIDSE